LGESFINASGALRGEVANVCLGVIASAAKQSMAATKRKMDCFAEPVIGRRYAPTRWLATTTGAMDCFAASGAHSRDPLARNNGTGHTTVPPSRRLILKT
jgi:hypothetical protein